jgi:hypothetical protein
VVTGVLKQRRLRVRTRRPRGSHRRLALRRVRRSLVRALESGSLCCLSVWVSALWPIRNRRIWHTLLVEEEYRYNDYHSRNNDEHKPVMEVRGSSRSSSCAEANNQLLLLITFGALDCDLGIAELRYVASNIHLQHSLVGR